MTSTYELEMFLKKVPLIQLPTLCVIRVFSKVFTVITVISQIKTGTTENSWWTEINLSLKVIHQQW